MSAESRVLSFAAVGLHGRERCTRMASLAFLLMLTVGLGAQDPGDATGLSVDIARKIADAVSPAREIGLVVTAPDGDEAARITVREELVRALRARGIQPLEMSEGLVAVSVGCGSNLRERVCIAEIRAPGAARVLAVVTRPHNATMSDEAAPRLSLELARIFGQRAPILDIAFSDDRLYVLDPAALTLYRREVSGWQRRESRPLTPRRPWPRDIRGRVRVDGDSVEALLPGTTCHTDADFTRLSCSEDAQPWPLGLDNNGIDASRNFFNTPEGLPFYAAAPLDGTDLSGSRWVIADRSGALSFLDGSRRTVATAGRGEDVVALRSACGDGAFVLVSSRRERGENGDALQLFRVVQRHLISAAAPRDLPGRTTAVWAAPGATVATVVTHAFGADRYEAFQVRVACDW